MKRTIMQAMESSPSLLESMLPDSMLLAVASYLEGDDLLQLDLVSKKLHGRYEDLEKEVWKDVCHERWEDWPKYKWENLQKSKPQLASMTWKQRYLWVEKDHSRTRITQEDLETAKWYINFKESADGRGSATIQRCTFERGGLLWIPSNVGGPLWYRLVESEQRQIMMIFNDCNRYTIRRDEDGEWLIENGNNYIGSYHEEGQVFRSVCGKCSKNETGATNILLYFTMYCNHF